MARYEVEIDGERYEVEVDDEPTPQPGPTPEPTPEDLLAGSIMTKPRNAPRGWEGPGVDVPAEPIYPEAIVAYANPATRAIAGGLKGGASILGPYVDVGLSALSDYAYRKAGNKAANAKDNTSLMDDVVFPTAVFGTIGNIAKGAKAAASKIDELQNAKFVQNPTLEDAALNATRGVGRKSVVAREQANVARDSESMAKAMKDGFFRQDAKSLKEYGLRAEVEAERAASQLDDLLTQAQEAREIGGLSNASKLDIPEAETLIRANELHPATAARGEQMRSELQAYQDFLYQGGAQAKTEIKDGFWRETKEVGYTLQDLRELLKKVNQVQREAGEYDAAVAAKTIMGDPSKAAELAASAELANAVRPAIKAKMSEMVADVNPELAGAVDQLLEKWGTYTDVSALMAKGDALFAGSMAGKSPAGSLLSHVPFGGSKAAQVWDETAEGLFPLSGQKATNKELVSRLQMLQKIADDTLPRPRVAGAIAGAADMVPGASSLAGITELGGAALNAANTPVSRPTPSATPTPPPDLGAAKAAVADAVLTAGKQATNPMQNPAPSQIPQDSLFASPVPSDMPPPVLGAPGPNMGPEMPSASPILPTTPSPSNGMDMAPQPGAMANQETKPMPRSVERFFSLPTEAIAPEILQDPESQQLIVEAQNSAPAVKEKALGQLISKHKLLFETENPKFREYDIIISDGVPKITDDLKAAAYRKDLDEREATGKISFADATKYHNALNQTGTVLEFASDAKKLEKAASKPAPVPTPEESSSGGGGDSGSEVYPTKPRTYAF